MKKRNRCLGLLLCAGVLLAGCVLLSGCEVDSADEAQISISPDYVRLAPGQSVTLTASGWSRYKWGLSAPDLGRLSATTGNRVSYTALGSGNQTVTASATAVASGSNNVDNAVIAVGTATIVQ